MGGVQLRERFVHARCDRGLAVALQYTRTDGCCIESARVFLACNRVHCSLVGYSHARKPVGLEMVLALPGLSKTTRSEDHGR